MRRLYYVDREMCGGDSLPNDFELDDFCEELQGKVDGIEIVPVAEPGETAINRDRALISESVFFEALGEYLHR